MGNLQSALLICEILGALDDLGTVRLVLEGRSSLTSPETSKAGDMVLKGYTDSEYQSGLK